jgi:hypothetical protein
MASSSRFDGHFTDLSRGIARCLPTYAAGGYRRGQDDPFRSASVAPYAYAAAITSATALPAFQDLLNACRVDPLTGANTQRKHRLRRGRPTDGGAQVTR